MYRNLEAELKRQNVSRENLAKLLGISLSTLYSKLGQRSDFSLNQAVKIKEYLNLDIDLVDLFSSDTPQQTA